MFSTAHSPESLLNDSYSVDGTMTGSSRSHSSSSPSTISTPQSPRKPDILPRKPATATTTVIQSRPRSKMGSPCTAKKAPWRAPGNWQIPDIIKESHEKLKRHQDTQANKLQQSNGHANNTNMKNKATVENIQSPQKRPWIPMVKPLDILPLLPPITRTPKKPHAEFDSKMRKVLPRSKILDINPRDYYVGLSKVGSGANGAVVRATKRSNNKMQVAIKRCYIEDQDTPHHAYILRELRIMGCLSHPNLCQLKEASLWGDHLWMIMELMACSVFGLLFNTTVGLSEAMAIRVTKECLEGLVYLHSKNYMHRDIKCENILLGRNGQVKLADFGLATPLNRVNSARLGTAKWMAPEVVAENPYKENVDVWSMAITLIEMMDRVPPLYYLEGNREIYGEILYGNAPTFNFTSPSSAVSELLASMLDPEPERRPGARCVLTKIKQQISLGNLKCAKQAELGALVREVFPESV